MLVNNTLTSVRVVMPLTITEAWPAQGPTEAISKLAGTMPSQFLLIFAEAEILLF